jgi:outer membrane protein assembly factor BamB
MRIVIRCIAIGLALSFAQPGAAQEWTRFRGPNGSGISPAKTIPASWTDKDINWKSPLPGAGHSSPVLWNDRIFLTASDERTGQIFVLCLDVADGEQRWVKEFSLTPFRRHNYNTFASATPTVDADRVYVCLTETARQVLIALDHRGEIVWQKDLGPFAAQHGSGVSPIVHEGMIILPNEQDGDSFLIAVDTRTGETQWQTPRKTSVAAYSTPCVYSDDQGRTALIFNSQSHGISAIAPDTGNVLWEYADAFTQRSVSSPIVAAGLLIGSCGSGGGGNYVVAVRPGDLSGNRKPSLAYEIRRSAPYVPTSVSVGNRLFLWSDGGIVTCVEASSGKILWQERVGGNYFSSPVWIDERLFGVSTQGDVVVLAAADQFEVLARNTLGEPTHSTPAVAGGRMYIRGNQHLFSIGGTSR